MSQPTDQFQPGQRVRVIQQVQHKKWTAAVEGVVERYEQSKTGSWYAHSKDDKLWLDRLVIRKADGEVVECNLDQYTRIEALDESAPST